jgi:hypothetical protein
MINDEQLPADREASLARSKAQAERGESVPLERFMLRLRASIDRMKQLRQADQGQAVTPEA